MARLNEVYIPAGATGKTAKKLLKAGHTMEKRLSQDGTSAAHLIKLKACQPITKKKAETGSFESAAHFETVHILFTSPPSRPANGLRLEIGTNLDKEKSEFYFARGFKKILTEKGIEDVAELHYRHLPGELTEVAPSCTFGE